MLAGLGFVFGTECPIIDETLLPLLFLRRPLVSKADLNLSNDLELLVLLHPPKGWDYRHAQPCLGYAVVGMDASTSCMGEHFQLSYTATSTTAL